MPLVLVHGNPETEVIWDDILPHLEQHNPLRLSPPGFGAPIPPGFDCTADSYRDWLVDQLEELPQPVHLMGHDWGGAHVLRIAIERPDLIRSWITDAIGVMDPDYVWHDMAQGWQTPGVGENMVADMVSTPTEALAQRYESLGMGATIARQIAEGVNEDMGRAILALYRSAAQPVMRNLGASLEQAAQNPGLALIPTKDVYTGGEILARRAADRAEAKVALLDGLGHWWMCQNPIRGAGAISNFMNALSPMA